MKILILTRDLRADSGVSSVIVMLVQQFELLGHTVYIASLCGTGDALQRMHLSKDRFIDLSPYRSLWKKSWALHGLINQLQIEVVHSHMHKPRIVGYLAALRTHCVTAFTEHATNLVPPNRLTAGGPKDAIDSFIAHRTDCVIAVSQSVAATCVVRLRLVPSAITVIPNSVDCNRVKKRRPERTQKMILFVGRLTALKNVQLAIKIIDQIRKKGLDATLVIAGSGELAQELRHFVTKRNLQAYVDFKGTVLDMHGLFGQCDALLVTSRAEGSPLNILEAYAQGVVVVATRVPGVMDTVDHMYTGMLFDSNDYQEGAANLLRVITDQDFADSLRRNARKKLKFYTPRQAAERHVAAFLKAKGGKAS